MAFNQSAKKPPLNEKSNSKCCYYDGVSEAIYANDYDEPDVSKKQGHVYAIPNNIPPASKPTRSKNQGKESQTAFTY